MHIFKLNNMHACILLYHLTFDSANSLSNLHHAVSDSYMSLDYLTAQRSLDFGA